MKNKFILLLLMLVIAAGANAQDSNKPATGDVTAEVSLNLFGTSLQEGNLRFRYFNAEETAIRIGFGATYSYDKLHEEEYNSTFGLRIAPGIEKHFAGTDKLSPYIGAELPIGFNRTSGENVNFIFRGLPHPNFATQYRSGFNIGLNGVAGVDYYFASRFYAGFEIGAGITYQKHSDTERENKNNGEITTTPGFHSVRFSPFATGGIRVGFVF